MPLENPLDQIKRSSNGLLEQALSDMGKENQPDTVKIEAENVYVEQVVAEATGAANETEKPLQLTIQLNESQEKMALELRKALGLGFEVTLNSAVKYALFYAQNQELSVIQLEEYPSLLGSQSLKIKVTSDTLDRLRESGATEQLSECVVVGIQLLHERLINGTTKA